MIQQPLFGHEPPAIDPRFARLERHVLGRGAWLDRCPEWVAGQARLYDQLRDGLDWRGSRRVMYEREVEVPRLFASAGPGERPAIVEAMVDALSRRYRARLDQVGFALYRGGADSVAMHQDKVLKDLPTALVAVVSLGGPRRFLVRPRDGGASRSFDVGFGDLVVMGGTCQRHFEHGVPKQRHAPPRIAVMFRASAAYA